MAHPDEYQARANIMWAGTLAHNGICGGGRIEDWSSHAIEHEISAIYNVTHGAGLSVIFPALMSYVAQTKPGKIAQFGRRVFGITNPDDTVAASEGIQRLKDFFKSLGLPVTFAEIGIPNPDIDTMVRKLHELKGDTFGGYIKLTPADSVKIYNLAL